MKARKHKFSEIRQLPTSSGQKRKGFYSNQSIQATINDDNTPFYIDREPRKKRKPKALNSVQEQTQNLTWKLPRTHIGRQPRGPVDGQRNT